MYYKYEHELTPPYCYEEDKSQSMYWNEILNRPTDELIKIYKERYDILERERKNEPARKRKRKREWTYWLRMTHDLRDELNDIAQELKSRKY